MTAQVKPRPHISPSQINTFTRCGEAYRRSYIEREKLPPGVALLRGTSVHAGAELNNKQKIKSRKDISVKKIVEASVARFKNGIKADGLLLTSDEQGIGQRKVVGQAIDSTARMAEYYRLYMAPRRQPRAVEITHQITLPGTEYDLLGRLDMITDREEIQDLKTGKKPRSQRDWDTDVALSAYALTYQAIHKKKPRGILIDQIVQRKNGDIQGFEFSTSRTRDDMAVLVNRVNAMMGALRAGVFIPANTGSWWCSERWCGYARTCPYFNGSRIKGEET